MDKKHNTGILSPEDVYREIRYELGENYARRLKEWYLDAVLKSVDSETGAEEEVISQYVAFIVRRGAVLGMNLEKATNVRMCDQKGKRFLTDAGLLLQTPAIVSAYLRTGNFPRIIILDEMMVRGGNLRNFLSIFEKRIMDIMKVDEDSSQAAIVRMKLRDAVEISIFAGLENSQFLLGEYSNNCSMKLTCGKSRWHKISSTLSSLLFHLDVTNAGYICSQMISRENLEQIRRSTKYSALFTGTTYQNITSYAAVYSVGEKNVKAVLTLRMVPILNTDWFRMIPFVFMPALDEVTTARLWEKLEDSLNRNDIPPDLLTSLRSFREVPGLRSANELLSFIMSVVILCEVQKEFHIQWDAKDYERELDKMIRNYNMTNEKETERFLAYLLDNPVMDIHSFIELLENIVPEGKGDLIRMQDGEREVTAEERFDYRTGLEDIFWDMNLQEEKRSYQMQKDYENGFPIIDRGTGKTAVDSYLLVKQFFNDKQIRPYRSDIRYVTALVLQMMDAGVLSISANPHKEIVPVGFVQFAKAGEQSQLLHVLRKYEYLKLIRGLEMESRDRFISAQELLEQYAQSEECDLDKNIVTDLQKLLLEMKEAGQSPLEWGTQYIGKVDFNTKSAGERRRAEDDLFEKMSNHVDAFNRFIVSNHIKRRKGHGNRNKR